MSDFKSLTEVFNHVQEAIVIDLMEHVVCLEDQCLKALVDPPKGIYLSGSIEPLLQEGRTYYPKAFYPNPKSKIKDLATILTGEYKDDIVNDNGETLLTSKDLVFKKRFISTEPSVPATALKVAVGIVEQYISMLCWHSRRTHPLYRLELLVKPEFQDMIIRDEYVEQFARLRDKVQEFIQNDRWNLYFTKVVGTSLIIEKGIDNRVLFYYEHLFKSQETGED